MKHVILLSACLTTAACVSDGNEGSDPLVLFQRPAPAPVVAGEDEGAILEGSPNEALRGRDGVDEDHDHDHLKFDPIAHEDPFFALLNFSSFNEPELTAVEMAERSPLIVRGRIVSVSDGRVIDYRTGASNPLNTAVLQVAVTSAIKGEVGSTVSVEYLRGGIPVEDIAAVLPEREVVLHLREANSWDPSVYKISARSEAARGPLFELQTQGGLLISVGDSIVQPLAGGRRDPLGEPVKTLDDVENAIPDPN